MAEPVQMWLAGDGTPHETEAAAELHDAWGNIRDVYLGAHPGQIAAAEQFAHAVMRVHGALAPLLTRIAALQRAAGGA
jgi:hypothetical protein